jgi:4,5-dihydroxyphthalate decarboxylase
MYLKGELDATSVDPRRSYTSGLERRHIDLPENIDIIPLFPDPKEESIRFFKKTGVYIPHHTTVVRESILVEHPWVAISLMEAFEESKKIAIERLRRRPPALLIFGQHYLKELDDIFGSDALPYGIKANAKAIEMAQAFSIEQGLTKSKQPLDEIFPPEVIYREERLL